MVRFILAAALVAVAGTALAPTVRAEAVLRGELPRRGYLGAQFAAPDGRLKFDYVVPGEAAEAAGIRAGDVLLAVDDTRLAAPGALAAAMAGKRAGDAATLTVERDGAERTFTATLGPLPLEEGDGFDTIYDVVTLGDAQLRSILTVPAGSDGPLPAILWVQGLPCFPVEQPLGSLNAVTQLVHELTRSGYAVMRVEKSGVGDSTGEPCQQIGYHREVDGFRAALKALKANDLVDPDQVFVFGHSMGGVQGPFLAAGEDVAGVIVYGTVTRSWAEYLIENERRQARHDPQRDRAELERELRDRQRFLHEFLREERSVEDIAAEHPELRRIADADFPDGEHAYTRHVQFYRELDAADLAGAWAAVDAPVLALFGEFDFTTSWFDHEYIAEIVNQHRPGTARAVLMSKMFHLFNRRESLEQTLEAPWEGILAPELVELCLEWMAGVREGAKAPAG